MPRLPRFILPFAVLGPLAACAGSTGIYPSGPGTFTVSEFRAPALGGGAEAERVAEAEAVNFCAQWGFVPYPVAGGPGAYPGSVYGPSSFSYSFGCVPAQGGHAAPPQGGSAPPPPHS